MISKNSHQKRTIRIGFAEDHVLIRKALVKEINEFANCKVTYDADDGAELIAMIEKASDPPDICILDIFMPKMNGLNTMLKLRELWPEIKVLVLSSDATGYFLEMMIKSGANGCLVKDCDPSELETALVAIDEMGIYNPKGKNGYTFFQRVLSDKSKIPEFTQEEVELLQLCCSEMSYEEISTKTGASVKSIDGRRNSIFKKLKIRSRPSAVMFAIQAGLIQLNIDITRRFMRIKERS